MVTINAIIKKGRKKEYVVIPRVAGVFIQGVTVIFTRR